MRRRGFAGLLVVVAGVAVAAPALPAQDGLADLRVRLEGAPGVPLHGALVALLDPAGGVVAEGLSSEAGTRTLRAPPGTYRVRVRRIGFQPFVSAPVSLPHAGELRLAVESLPVMLHAVVVTARTQCRRIDRDAEALATVWDEATKALRASQLTLDDLRGIAQARLYRREVTPAGDVISSDTSILLVTDRRPFGALDPAVLARDGYVRGTFRRGWEYFGADETVLLSSEFMATHCFRLVREAERSGQIGVAFEPVPGRRTADIAGVLWVDEATAELRELVYRYTNAGSLSRFDASGYTHFRRMPSGAWLVDEWWLRMPRLGIRPGSREHIIALGYIENGGGIVTGDRRPVATGSATVTGTVYDSLAWRPLGGAIVALEGTAAAADEHGRFTFTGVPSGRRSISFSHPALSTLGFVALERELNVTGDTSEVHLAVPSLAGAWLRLCDDSADTDASRRAILHGTVRDAAGEPAAGAAVRVFWSDSRAQTGVANPAAQLALEVTSGDDGRYVACGFSSRARGTVSATSALLASERRDFSFTAIPVARRDLTLALSTMAQEAAADPRREVVVTVTDPAGAPLADATVFIDGTTATARTNDEGRASLFTTERQITIVARRVGFGEAALRVSLGDGRRQQLRVPLSSVQTLATVEVIARAPIPPSVERRRNWGRGTFYGPEEIAAVHQARTLIGRTPGVVIEGSGKWAVRLRHPAMGGDCWADLYIDGRLSAPMLGSFGPFGAAVEKYAELDALSPAEIYAMEVYPLASQAPQAIVHLRDGCGVILVWTRQWAERELEREQRRQRVAADTTSGR